VITVYHSQRIGISREKSYDVRNDSPLLFAWTSIRAVILRIQQSNRKTILAEENNTETRTSFDRFPEILVVYDMDFRENFVLYIW